MTQEDTLVVDSVHRRVRVVSILSGARDAGLTPLPSRQLHAVAYFADALAPVWDLRILDSQLLKRREGPSSPALQRDVDALVGAGVLRADSLRHAKDADGVWRLEANYDLDPKLSAPILEASASYPQTGLELRFVREVVYALSGLGVLGIVPASTEDASYADRQVDFGSMLSIGGETVDANPSARVAMRIGDLMESEVELTDAEEIHLYVRELHKRVSHAE